jgi:hypothetical protein
MQVKAGRGEDKRRVPGGLPQVPPFVGMTGIVTGAHPKLTSSRRHGGAMLRMDGRDPRKYQDTRRIVRSCALSAGPRYPTSASSESWRVPAWPFWSVSSVGYSPVKQWSVNCGLMSSRPS